MIDSLLAKTLLPFAIGLAACGAPDKQDGEKAAFDVRGVSMAAAPQDAPKPTGTGPSATRFPDKYMNAFACVFDENPIAAAERTRGTPAGRAERARDLTTLRSLGFSREARDYGLESVGGKITAPPGLTILGLPVRFLELNGMVGGTNAMYVTTFDKSVTVDRVVKAARLELDRDMFNNYQMRHYSRRVGSKPFTELTLDDRGSGIAVLVCQVQSTPH